MTLEWTAPGGGSWELETLHVRCGQPRVFQHRAPRAFRHGFTSAAARYGLPIDDLEQPMPTAHRCSSEMTRAHHPAPVAELLGAILLEFELEAALQRERRDVADSCGDPIGIGTEPYTGPACVAAAPRTRWPD